jgi:hypothetical protein
MTIWIIGFLFTTGVYQADSNFKTYHTFLLAALWPIALGLIVGDVFNAIIKRNKNQ